MKLMRNIGKNLSELIGEIMMVHLDDRVGRQTNDEWLREYEFGVRVEPAEAEGVVSASSVNTKVKLKYLYHRTARNKHSGKGFLVLCFVNVETDDEVFAFFNVDTTIQRGARKGKDHKIGRRGQYLSLPRSSFRKFWMSIIGKNPRRWATTYKELSARLKGVELTGGTSIGFWSDGSKYLKVREITKWEQ